MNQNEFLANERASRDTIDVKRVYIMMAGDHAAGVLLSQIVYWHLPDKEGNPRLTVKRDNYLWLAKKREDWWDEICMLPKQFDRAIKELENRELVKTEIFRFDGSPTKHIRLNWDMFLRVYESIINDDKPSFNPDSPEGGKWIFPDREYRNSRIGNIETPESGISEIASQPTPSVAPALVESGPETTTEITTENNINHHHLINPGGQSGKDDDFEENEKDKQTHSVRKSFNPGVLERNSNLPLDEYMNAVESKLSALQIRQVLSSLESPKLAEMYRTGVPLNLITRTIDTVTRNSKRKIKSFNYFVEAIWEAFDATFQNQKDRTVEYKATQNLIERLR